MFPGPTPRAFSAVVLAVALLFCHGVFGYEHGLTEPAWTPAASAAQHSQHHGPDTDPGAHYGQVPDGGFFATLLVLLLGTLLLRGLAPAGSSLATRKRRNGTFRPPVLHRPLGPTAPVLQVFRL